MSLPAAAVARSRLPTTVVAGGTDGGSLIDLGENGVSRVLWEQRGVLRVALISPHGRVMRRFAAARHVKGSYAVKALPSNRTMVAYSRPHNRIAIASFGPSGKGLAVRRFSWDPGFFHNGQPSGGYDSISLGGQGAAVCWQARTHALFARISPAGKIGRARTVARGDNCTLARGPDNRLLLAWIGSVRANSPPNPDLCRRIRYARGCLEARIFVRDLSIDGRPIHPATQVNPKGGVATVLGRPDSATLPLTVTADDRVAVGWGTKGFRVSLLGRDGTTGPAKTISRHAYNWQLQAAGDRVIAIDNESGKLMARDIRADGSIVGRRALLRGSYESSSTAVGKHIAIAALRGKRPALYLIERSGLRWHKAVRIGRGGRAQVCFAQSVAVNSAARVAVAFSVYRGRGEAKSGQVGVRAIERR